jgi:trimethylamine:corrinoid methyltransferase-like protein
MTGYSSIVQPKLSVLNGQQIEQIHHYSLEILSKVGLRVDSARALAVFSRAGVQTVTKILCKSRHGLQKLEISSTIVL